MSFERRIARLEETLDHRERTHLYATIAAELGLTVDALLDEAEQFLAQSLADQLAEVDRIHAEMVAQGVPWPEVQAIKATLRREYQP